MAYFNPTKVLEEALRQGFRHELGGSPVRPTSEYSQLQAKRLIEDLDAAAFAHGLRALLPERGVCIAEFEALDHDFILRFGPPSAAGYCPLQLKVLVAPSVDRALTPEAIFGSLNKYVSSADLVLAIKIDRLGIDPRALTIPKLGVGELWLFGELPEQRGQWYLYGDCLDVPQVFRYSLPSTPSHDANETRRVSPEREDGCKDRG